MYDLETMLDFHRNERSVDNTKPRCGFCGRVVSGDVTSIALASEAHNAHPDSFLRGSYNAEGDYEVYACDDGEGCAQ